MVKLKKAVAGLVLGVTVAGAVATPAEAQRWRGGRGYYGHGYGGYGGGYRGYYGRRGGVSTGAAVGIGLLGLGVGAALASRPRYDDGYYGRGYGYYGGPGYYDRGYYGRGYYGRDCFTRRVYDPYLGRRVRVRYCD